MVLFRRLAAIWFAQIRYSITRDMAFRASFLLWLGVEVMWLALQLTFIEVVFQHTESVAGWGKFDMVLLAGANQLVSQIFQALFMVNLLELPELIRTGKLDFYLTRPAPVQFLLSTRLFDLGAILNALLAVGVCVYGVSAGGLHLTALGLAQFAVGVALGVTVHYSLMLALVTASFWIIRGHGVVGGYWSLFQIARLPRDAFYGVARAAFTYGVPLLLVANVPAEGALGRGGWEGLALLAGSATALFCGATAFFRFGLTRYGSASS